MHIQAPNFLTSTVSEANFGDSTMGYDNQLPFSYRDEDGEPLVDSNVESERNEPQQLVLDVASNSEGSLIPACNDTNTKSRKLIIKMKSDTELGPAPPTSVYSDPNPKCGKLLIKLKSAGPTDFGLDGINVLGLVKDDCSGGRKKKKEKEKGENRRKLGKKRKAEKGEIKSKIKKSRRRGVKDPNADSEIQEMWDTITGGNTEDGQIGVRTVDEENIVDDSGADPSYSYGSDTKHLPSPDPQAKVGKVDDEIEELFKIGKKKKKEIDPAATVLLVESVVYELVVAAEEDAELNRQEKPAIIKLRNLSLLTDIIPRKHLQEQFIDAGGLRALRLWLEPLPNGSVPNINVRGAVFKCLNDLSIDLEREDHKKVMIDSGLGKAIMFYYKWDEETTANKKLAKELVDKWSRDIFENTTYEGLNNDQVKRTYKRPPLRKAMSNAGAGASLNDDLDLSKLSQGLKSEPSSSRQRASRPEATSMDFVVRPPSKVDPEAVRAQAKRVVQGQHRAQLNKKLERMKAPKRKQLQAVKPSAEGRGMVKYL